MPFTETLEALGSWELELAEETPDELIAQLGYYGHMVVVDGQVDVDTTGNGLLAAARYVGVCRARSNPSTFTRGGSGLLFWISDEDGKGHTLESTITLTNATLAQVVTALMPPTVTIGTVFPQAVPATRYTGTHVFQSRRDALRIALAPFGAELRVNPNFTVDVGTPGQLYDTALPLTTKPSPMIVRRGAGSDLDLVAVGGKVETEGAVYDYTTKATLLGQTIGVGDEPDTVFAVGSASAPSVPWKDPQGSTVKFVRLISESGETSGTVAARAQLQLNRFSRETAAIKVTAADYEISGGFGVGDASYVYDPDSGILDTAVERLFRGQPIHPAIVRVSSISSPIVEGMTIAWRTDTGVWLDLTRWVVWESAGSREITVGDLPKTLSRPSDPIADRVDAARGKPSTKVPKAPTGLTLSTSSAINPKGTDSATITASWSAVTQYTDNTTVALHHYEVQFRPTYRAPQWLGNALTDATTVDLAVVAALGYDVQVRAVSTGGVASAWTSTSSITSAADSTGPAAPADPVLTQSLGQIRVRYPGTTSVGGAMPADANRVDVEVAAAGSGGPFVVESSLNPFVEGIHRVGGTPGQTRWVRLRAYDHNGNGSAYSATVSAVIPQVNDGEIGSLSVGKLTAGTMAADVVMAGRFTTALTGQRREMNAIGWQAFDALNALTVNIDGVNNLLTGIFKTALSGRRIEIGAAGTTGKVQFFAPDGTEGYVRGFTATSGVEAMQMQIPIAGAGADWNSVIVNSVEQVTLVGKNVVAYIGGAATGTRTFTIFYAPDKANTSTGIQTLYQATPLSHTFVIPNGGDFFINEQTMTRLWMDAGGGNFVYHAQGQATSIVQRNTDGSLHNRFFVDDNDVTFLWPGSISKITVNPPDFAPFNSARMQFVNGNSFGGYLKLYYDGTGAIGLHSRNGTDTGWQAFFASAFTVSSDARLKEEMTDATGDFLSDVMTTRVKRYRRKPDAEGRNMPVEIGLDAGEAPPQIVVKTIDDMGAVDLYQYTALLHAALQQFVTEVRGGPAAPKRAKGAVL
ncbi:tail fiber domain-containing protein [Blastococcus sp. CT_GayMR16]|uniref:tail fiber domain-containing protein n=1 Tax=Blastococcus sp. CT_GayMR16 TaxID=2559607 RepID=UPI0010736C91|nr:tail fiber domain-containing protein [Blastococcus sp. CT_GayMR16]TFV90383.1 tail fiber domain-containing protein [Blastococcus sp. CT_GayMR16]